MCAWSPSIMQFKSFEWLKMSKFSFKINLPLQSCDCPQGPTPSPIDPPTPDFCPDNGLEMKPDPDHCDGWTLQRWIEMYHCNVFLFYSFITFALMHHFTRFLECWNGVLTAQQCPFCDYYDVDKQQCNQVEVGEGVKLLANMYAQSPKVHSSLRISNFPFKI